MEELVQIQILHYTDRYFQIGKFVSRRSSGSSSVTSTEFRCVCMESVRGAQGGPNLYYT